MKVAAKRKILSRFWLLVAVFQLLFAAQLAPARSIPGLENRVWKILPLAAQTHQVGQLQVGEAQRERAPPVGKIALDDVLAAENGCCWNYRSENRNRDSGFGCNSIPRSIDKHESNGGEERTRRVVWSCADRLPAPTSTLHTRRKQPGMNGAFSALQL